MVSKLKSVFAQNKLLQSRPFRVAAFWLFPAFIVTLCEFNHLQNLSTLATFFLQEFGVFIFDTIVVGAVFLLFLLLFKKAWIAGLITGLLFYILSCVEYFKFSVSGSHFFAGDLAMTTKLGDMQQFAVIQPTAVMGLNLLLLLSCVALFWLTGLGIRLNGIKRAAFSTMIVGGFGFVLFGQTFLASVCTVFGIQYDAAPDSFSQNQLFQENNLIASFIVSANEQLNREIVQPEGYSSEKVQSVMAPAGASTPDFAMPNVLFIMSESYADFRKYPSLQIDPDTYDGFDRLAEEGYRGNITVPTFGGYTVRSEFELTTGLPVRSLGNAQIPIQLLDTSRENPSFARIYQNLGYTTSYIHPFSASFYGREEVYSTYGFDNLIFEDGLTVPQNEFRGHTDDATVYAQILDTMRSTTGRDYIFTTTLQNHEPYSGQSTSELDAYLEGICLSDSELEDFINMLRGFEEPTVVVFVGDHFPFFSPSDNVYEKLGVQSDNCAPVYQQSSLIWANYQLDYTAISNEQTSAFYLPHMVYRLIGAPENAFVNTVLSIQKQVPVYSPTFVTPVSEELDLLTYDLLFGDRYSDASLQDGPNR